MKLSILSLLLSSISLTLIAEPFKVGSPLTLKPSDAIELTKALSQHEELKGKDFLLKGKVSKVCEKKGCWMTVGDDKNTIRVVFIGYSFFVPEKLEGKTILAEGRISQKKSSVAEQKHYLKDAGEGPQAIKAVTQPKLVFEFEAKGVETLSEI